MFAYLGRKRMERGSHHAFLESRPGELLEKLQLGAVGPAFETQKFSLENGGEQMFTSSMKGLSEDGRVSLSSFLCLQVFL